jgi:hypothetical protein
MHAFSKIDGSRRYQHPQASTGRNHDARRIAANTVVSVLASTPARTRMIAPLMAISITPPDSTWPLLATNADDVHRNEKRTIRWRSHAQARLGLLPPIMEKTSIHAIPAGHSRDILIRSRRKALRNDPRPFLRAPSPPPGRTRDQLNPTVSVLVIVID